MKTSEVELNITPIIDCFTVLITFLLASASFIQIGFLEAETPTQSNATSAEEPEAEILLTITSPKDAEFSLKGKINSKFQIHLDLKSDWAKLDETLHTLEAQHLKGTTILLTAENHISYKTVTEVIEHLNQFPFPLVIGEFAP